MLSDVNKRKFLLHLVVTLKKKLNVITHFMQMTTSDSKATRKVRFTLPDNKKNHSLFDSSKNQPAVTHGRRASDTSAFHKKPTAPSIIVNKSAVSASKKRASIDNSAIRTLPKIVEKPASANKVVPLRTLTGSANRAKGGNSVKKRSHSLANLKSQYVPEYSKRLSDSFLHNVPLLQITETDNLALLSIYDRPKAGVSVIDSNSLRIPLREDDPSNCIQHFDKTDTSNETFFDELSVIKGHETTHFSKDILNYSIFRFR